ncbi:MAG: hypothetical protein WAN93_01490 [Solirubrobacteraceae bacterium]
MPMRTGQPLYLRRLTVVAVFMSAFALAALAVWVLLAAPASANKSAPEYSLSVLEGADTQPEDSIEHVSASVNENAEVSVSLTHNGLVVAQDTGKGYAGFSQAPQVGDVLTFASQGFTTAVTYDGLPSLDPTVCVGSNNFSGQRTLGYTVEGGYYTVARALRHTYYSQHTLAQIQVLSGSAFGGSFLNPLVNGDTVYAAESLSSPLPGGATFTYYSENDRPVGGCPPPPPPPQRPAPLALTGAFSKFTRISIAKLLRSGWPTRVTINQPGQVIEDLYQHSGAVPAFAATSKHKRKERKALLLARGTASATVAGTVTVTIHPTSAGRRLLKHAHSAKVVLVTTLTAKSGAKLALARHSLTLHR